MIEASRNSAERSDIDQYGMKNGFPTKSNIFFVVFLSKAKAMEQKHALMKWRLSRLVVQLCARINRELYSL